MNILVSLRNVKYSSVLAVYFESKSLHCNVRYGQRLGLFDSVVG